MKKYFKILLVVSAVVLSAAGCGKQQAIGLPISQTGNQQAAQESNKPTPQFVESSGPHFLDAKFGFSFDFPASWHTIECKNDQGGKVEPNFIEVFLGDGEKYDCQGDAMPVGYYTEVNLLKNVDQSKAFIDLRVTNSKDLLDNPIVTSILVDGKAATKISGKMKAVYANPNQSAGSPAVFIELPYNQDLFDLSYQETKVSHKQAFDQIVSSFKIAAAGGQAIPPAGQSQTKDNPKGPDFFPNGQQPGGVAKAPTITVTQTVEGSNFNKLSDVVPVGENGIDLLKRDHKIETKNYSGIGDFVTSIDGVTPDSKHFWAFYINGKSSNVGASSYILKAGDKIEWKLEAISGSNQ